MPDPGWWEALWPEPAKVLRDVGVNAGMDVVDLCSGDGWFTLPLSRIARSVIAIDIDAALLEWLIRSLRRLGRAMWVRSSGRALALLSYSKRPGISWAAQPANRLVLHP